MNWQQFLDDVFLGDQEAIDFVQRLMGFAFSGAASAGRLVVCWGNGRSGKTTFFTAIESAVDDLLITNIHFDGGILNQDQYKKALAIQFLIEDESQEINSTGIRRYLKPLYKRGIFPFLVTNKCTYDFFEDLNHNFQRTSIEFKAFFSPGSPDVLDALYKDRDAIKRWLAEGMARWHEEGLRTPERFGLLPKRREA